MLVTALFCTPPKGLLTPPLCGTPEETETSLAPALVGSLPLRSLLGAVERGGWGGSIGVWIQLDWSLFDTQKKDPLESKKRISVIGYKSIYPLFYSIISPLPCIYDLLPLSGLIYTPRNCFFCYFGTLFNTPPIDMDKKTPPKVIKNCYGLVYMWSIFIFVLKKT